jgi:uncharacterized repeat protein (TIGR01451 family)
LFIVFTLTIWSPQAHANTAAGTAIVNSVTVDYDDAGGVAQAQVTDSVSITVNLVGSVAWGALPAGATTSSGAALPAAYTIPLQNMGNGSDTFTITDNTSESDGDLSAGTFVVTPDEDGGTAGVQITLFGTVSSGAGVFGGGNTTIPVGNLTLADLTAGTTQVVINGTTYTVAAGSTATQLVVSGDATADVAAAGVQIGEVATVTYNGTAGTLSNGLLTATHDHDLNATGTSMNGNAAATADSGVWQTTVNGAQLTVAKYVRNVTNAAGNPGAGGTPINGQTYFDSGVTGNPGDTLEYVVDIVNAAAGLATDVVFSDTLSAFTTYVASSVEVDTNGDGTYDVTIGGGETEGTEAGGIIVVSGSSITVYAGVGGDESTPLGGNIAGGGTENSVVLYQATIN